MSTSRAPKTPKSSKTRADHLTADLGLAESREKAKRLIMAGQVLLVENGREEPVAKPGQPLPANAVLKLKQTERFVSRGGYKLLTAVEHFGLDFSGAVVLDAGASTGGFTDCALQHGAVRVYAADVGKGQLHEKLQADPRVVNLEGVNVRYGVGELLPGPVDAVVADVSFISLTKVLPPCVEVLKPGGLVVALVKPQFELSPAVAAKHKGVIKDEALRRQAVDKVTTFCVERLGLSHLGTIPSAITGPKGNQEYLACFKLTNSSSAT